MDRESENIQKALKGKLFITAKLKVMTGMHIGGSSAFAPIGAVDSPVIRDTLSRQPIIPGSSLKGKLRTLLVRNSCDGYILNEIEDDKELIVRNFGSAADKNLRPARLQFFDLFVAEESLKKFADIETDTYLGEIKFENSIGRASGIANPRQIERVPAGMEFDFKLVYNIEQREDVEEDMELLAKGLKLLRMDYLGGHGSRGYGRVEIKNYAVQAIGIDDPATDRYAQILEGSCL